MTMPSETPKGPSWFDKLADRADDVVSKSPFFAFSVILVLIWLPTFFVLPDVDTWQLLINTPTTVLTYLLVSIAANTTKRSTTASNKRENAIADALADLMEVLSKQHPELDKHHTELREAVGQEKKEGT